MTLTVKIFSDKNDKLSSIKAQCNNLKILNEKKLVNSKNCIVYVHQ